MPSESSSPQSSTAHPRLLSLDAFRGLDIALMVFVNMTWDRSVFPGQFFHVGWNEGRMGATVTDLVFPWFLFIAGCAIPWSMYTGRGRGRSPGSRILLAFRRGLVIYTLGTLLSAVRAQHLQVLTLDILQFIGIAYFIGVCVAHLPRWGQYAFIALVLAGKYVLMHHAPHPAHGAVVWEQRDNLREWITAFDFGLGALNRVPQWLANGLFNILPGATVVVAGSLAGEALRQDWGRRHGDGAGMGGSAGASVGTPAHVTLAVVGLVVWAASFGLKFVDPYSKDFFTASYALLSIGSGLTLLAFFYWVIDVKRWMTLWWARVWGLNALAFYMASELLFRSALTRWTQPWVVSEAGAALTLVEAGRTLPVRAWTWAAEVAGLADPARAGLVAGRWTWVLLYMALWWVVFYGLYRKRWFWRV